MNRRFFLQAAGVSVALPYLESFAAADNTGNDKKRLVCIYFPDGCPLPPEKDPAREKWHWNPLGTSESYRLTDTMRSIKPLKDKVTFYTGLSHPAARNIHGHSNGDIWLTGARATIRGNRQYYKNSISLDQVYANAVGDKTRLSSLVLSTDGGTGTPRGATTISFNSVGKAIPAESKPRRIFDYMFKQPGKARKNALLAQQSILDGLLESSRSLKNKVSSSDQERLDEYFSSIRELEKRIDKAQQWIEHPVPEVDEKGLALDADPSTDSRNYLRTMYDLIYLAIKTDTTRTVTYQIGQEGAFGASDGLSRAVDIPQAHETSHDMTRGKGWKRFGTYNQYLMDEYARFLKKLDSTMEGGKTLLENSLCIYGSSSSTFHLSKNYPLLFAGGENIGFKNGRFLQFNEEKTPLANLYLTVLQKFGLETASFADSTGTLTV